MYLVTVWNDNDDDDDSDDDDDDDNGNLFQSIILFQSTAVSCFT